MGSNYQSDPALIEACLRGEQSAWNEMIDRYGRLVYSVPRRCGLSETDADDIFQNVFAIALRRLEQLQDHTRLSAWLVTTTHRECWRHGGRKPLEVDLDEREIRADEPPSDLAEKWELQSVVRRGLERLGDPCKALLEALFLKPADLGYEEIARQLDIKVGSIGPTRARCFRKFEAILREMGIDEFEGF